MIISALKAYLLDVLARLIKSNPTLRKRVANEVAADYFSDLELTFKIGNYVVIPLRFSDSLYSFREVFIDREYADVFHNLPNEPLNWLDLGSNNGYFSLWLASIYLEKNQNFKPCSVLVDPDPRSLEAFHEILRLNPWAKNLSYIKAGVLPPGERKFTFIFGSKLDSHVKEVVDPRAEIVTRLDEGLLKKLSGWPFKLVKADLEGMEVDLINHYPSIIRNAQILLIEWHSWNPSNTSKDDFHKLLVSKGFQVKENRSVNIDVERSCCNFICIRS